MTTNTPAWSTAKIKFQTAANIPAPYAYFYTIELGWTGVEMDAKLVLDYLDRDQLDEESILDEGFTMDDDYSWQGKLPQEWNTELISRLNTEKLSEQNDISENENFIEVEFQDGSGKTERQYPVDGEEWDYFQHEFLQAIYEISEKELPFQMTYLEIDHGNKLNLMVRAEFATRLLSIQVNEDEPKAMPWELTREVMETVFRADFLAEYALDRLPKTDGKYVNTGDDLWYKFGESLVEPAPKSKILPKIVALLDRLR